MNDDWKHSYLGNHMQLLTGFPFSSEKYTDSLVSVRLLRGDNIRQGYIDWTDAKKWPVSELDSLRAYLLQEGDVVLAMDRTWVNAGLKLATVTRGDCPCLLVQRVARIRGRDGVTSQFLRHTLESHNFTEYVKSVQTATAVPHISAKQICDFPILIPPSDQQVVISGLLDLWDRGIRQLSDLVAAKIRFKQGLMQQLLTGRRRFPEFRVTAFNEHHVGDVLKETFRPVEWDEEELYRLASIRRKSGGLFWREALLGKQIKVKKLHSLCQGDFLISHIQAAYGAMGLVPTEFAGGKVSNMYTILTPNDESRIDMRYIDYLSQMERMRHQAYLACNGFFAERLRLNFDPAEFLKQTILLPESFDEQSKIADVLDTLVSEIKTLQRELDALKTQKKGLMQKLLTGQVRVKLPDPV